MERQIALTKKQALSGFQMGIDLAKFELSWMPAGSELWRVLDQKSVRSRVEGQTLREQTLLIAPPEHLKRLLHIFPHMDPNLQDHDNCKRHLLLHGSLATFKRLERLVVYDEQLRVLNYCLWWWKGDPKGKKSAEDLFCSS